MSQCYCCSYNAPHYNTVMSYEIAEEANRGGCEWLYACSEHVEQVEKIALESEKKSVIKINLKTDEITTLR